MNPLKTLLRIVFGRADQDQSQSKAPEPPIVTFEQAADTSFRDSQTFRSMGQTVEKNNAYAHYSVLKDMSLLDKIIPSEGAELTPTVLTHVYCQISNLGDGAVARDYSFVGLAILLGKTREGYIHFTTTDDADKIDDFDLIKYEEEMSDNDGPFPEDVRKMTVKAWRDNPWRQKSRQMAQDDQNAYLYLIDNIRGKLSELAQGELGARLSQVDARYIPSSVVTYATQVLEKEFRRPSAGQGMTPE